jgi:hypothetical protein
VLELLFLIVADYCCKHLKKVVGFVVSYYCNYIDDLLYRYILVQIIIGAKTVAFC